GIVQAHADDIAEIVGASETRQRSLAFVLLCVTSFLGITLSEAMELITEGGNDQGVDALHLGEVDDGEFTVTIFQGKYSHKNLDGTSNFPENAVKNAINLVGAVFDPQKELAMNERLAPRVEEVRSLIRDGYIPNV
ncbi:hypothetical protein, partial [Mycobacterium tuberculosis]|uniref:hypothetical protein n=1 Tax=Mycobacterium tuberculosis TaxID=1773 RepID=UPI00214ED20A